jgi:hypothetical protein
MTTKLTIKLIFLLTIFLTACGQTKSKSTIDKRTINVERIDRIEISKRSTPPDSTIVALKTLTSDQVNSFADKWNQTGNPELRKYSPSYNLSIYLKHGATRHFRVEGKYIKENNDYCYDFGDDNYFPLLYANAQTLTVNPDSLLKSGWYYITDQETNFRRQLDKTNEYYYIDPNVIVPVEQFKEMELIDSEYEGEECPMLSIKFDTKGTESWSDATEKSIARKLALIVNDKLVIAPIVNSQITIGISALNRIGYTKHELEEILNQLKIEQQTR